MDQLWGGKNWVGGVSKIASKHFQELKIDFFFRVETKTVESVTDIKADINKKYRCVSGKQISLRNVTVTLRDATIQAYLSNGSFSREGEDRPGPAPWVPGEPCASSESCPCPSVFREGYPFR